MSSPSTVIYCASTCSCSNEQNAEGTFIIHRNDTCPVLEVLVKGKDGQPVDLTGWTATATLFSINSLFSGIDDNDVEISFNDPVSNMHVGDVLRAESEDYPLELMQVTAIDRDADSATVTRGYDSTTAVTHRSDEPIYIIKADDIPVSIVMTTEVPSEIDSSNIGGSEDSDTPVLVETKLAVGWRASDTAHSGYYLVQIELISEDESQKMTLPRSSSGYRVAIPRDANSA